MGLLGQWGGTGPAPPVNSPPDEKTYQPATRCEVVPFQFPLLTQNNFVVYTDESRFNILP